MKLLTNIYQVGGPSLTHFFDATVTLLKGKDGWFLIDCGTPEGYEQVKENIRKAGVEPSQIKFILGTHGHYDHVGAAHLWKEEFGCRLFLHALDREQVEAGGFRKNFRCASVRNAVRALSCGWADCGRRCLGRGGLYGGSAVYARTYDGIGKL